MIVRTILQSASANLRMNLITVQSLRVRNVVIENTPLRLVLTCEDCSHGDAEELAESYDASASTRSFLEVAASLVKSTTGMQQWTLGDITLGLYLLSLRHTSDLAVDGCHGEQVTCDHTVNAQKPCFT